MNLPQSVSKALVPAFFLAASVGVFCILRPTSHQQERLRDHVEERILHHEPGFKKDPRQLSDVYIPRGKPLDSASRKKLKEKWGDWSFVDPKADQRASEERLFAKYPYRDVPGDAFPATAWQRDSEYLAAFLPEAKALVHRALEAILAEYGHGPDDEPGKSFEERSKIFSLTFEDTLPKEAGGNGGVTTEKSFRGLSRRILHAIMTEDSFVLAMGGHSTAAGHGNAFQQAYTPQFQRTVEPVFERLGVHCLARSIAYGGMGTLQTSLASGSILGTDLDMLVWDSGYVPILMILFCFRSIIMLTRKMTLSFLLE